MATGSVLIPLKTPGTPSELSQIPGFQPSSPTPRTVTLPTVGTIGTPAPSISIPRSPVVPPAVSLAGPSLATAKSYGTPELSPQFKSPYSLVKETPILAGTKESLPAHPHYSTALGSIRDPSIENQLADKGFIVTDRIFLSPRPGGTPQGRYAKAVNDRGQIVFIDLDIDGYISHHSTDLTMIETQQASVVPYSVMMGTAECAGKDVCGVAFECSGQLCTLTRSDPDLTPKTTILTTTEKTVERTATIDGIPIAYPIIRLSEIMANPKLASKSVDEVTRRIRNTSYNACMEENTKVRDAISTLSTKFAQLARTQNQKFLDLGKSIQTLEQYRGGYEQQSDPQKEKETEKSKKTAFNLRRRHELFVDLIRLCQGAASYLDQITTLNSNMTEYIEFINKAYDSLDKVYEE